MSAISSPISSQDPLTPVVDNSPTEHEGDVLGAAFLNAGQPSVDEGDEGDEGEGSNSPQYNWCLMHIGQHDGPTTPFTYMVKVKVVHGDNLYRTAVKDSCSFVQFRAQVLVELRGSLDYGACYTAKYVDEDDDLVSLYTTSAFVKYQFTWERETTLKYVCSVVSSLVMGIDFMPTILLTRTNHLHNCGCVYV